MFEFFTLKFAASLAGVAGVSLIALANFWPRNTSVPPVPFSDDVLKILEAAAELARKRRDAAVTAEHILVAILDMPPSLTPGLADSEERARLRERLRSNLRSGMTESQLPTPVYTDSAHKVLIATAQVAFAKRLNEAGVEELLAAILRNRKSGAARALVNSGLLQLGPP